MTDIDLAAIRQRVEKATEGPWNTGFDYERNDPTVITPGHIEHTIDYTLTEGGLEHGKADAEFIAHAREDVPALLDEIDRLRKDLSYEVEQKIKLAEMVESLRATIDRVQALAEKMQNEHGQSWNSISGNRVSRALEGGEQ